jgi:hypothetical protein
MQNCISRCNDTWSFSHLPKRIESLLSLSLPIKPESKLSRNSIVRALSHKLSFYLFLKMRVIVVVAIRGEIMRELLMGAVDGVEEVEGNRWQDYGFMGNKEWKFRLRRNFH